MDFIEHLLTHHVFRVGPDSVPVYFELYFTGDFAGVRAIENSICGCRPEAMHAVPAAADVSTLPALQLACALCDCHASAEQRTIRAHEPVNGVVRPCDCCSYGRDRSSAAAEREAFVDKLEGLVSQSSTEAGKKELSTFIAAHK
eukprot:358667-Pleurochrysis_carterae.AAC.1